MMETVEVKLKVEYYTLGRGGGGKEGVTIATVCVGLLCNYS